LKQVSEIVRDAAGERADGLELLCLPELFFELAIVRNVSGHAHDVRLGPVDQKGSVVNPANFTVRSHNPVLLIEWIALEQQAPRVRDMDQVVGVQGMEPIAMRDV
jgi:hypothetical protein